MSEHPPEIPEVARLDYAPPPARRRLPWLAIISAPILGIAVFCLGVGVLIGNGGRITDRVMFISFGAAFAVCGGIWFWIGVLRR